MPGLFLLAYILLVVNAILATLNFSKFLHLPFYITGEGEDGGGGGAGSGAVRPAGGVGGRGAGTLKGGPETAPG